MSDVITKKDTEEMTTECQAAIDEAYKSACNGKVQDKVSVQAMLTKANVTVEDFQAVCNNHPEIIQNIGGGSTCRVLGMSADQVVTQYKINPKTGKKTAVTGGCHTGVMKIHQEAQIISKKSMDPEMQCATTDSLTCKQARVAAIEYRKDRPYQGGFNGGCAAEAMLEASGDYIVLDVQNAAYGKTKDCAEDKQMNALFFGIQPGVTGSVDSIEDATIRKEKKNTAGGKWGHDFVKRNDGKVACDFVQSSMDFSRYGEYAHACFPKDAYVSEEYAKMVIAHAQERQLAEQQLQQAETQSQTTVSEGQIQPTNDGIGERVEQQLSQMRDQIGEQMRNQIGELPEDKEGRDGAAVALKAGPVNKGVAYREAKKELDKTDERSVHQAMKNEPETVQTAVPQYHEVKEQTPTDKKQQSKVEQRQMSVQEITALLRKNNHR